MVKCLSKAVRDAVVKSTEHKVSEECRKQLRVEKMEIVSYYQTNFDFDTEGDFSVNASCTSWYFFAEQKQLINFILYRGTKGLEL